MGWTVRNADGSLDFESLGDVEKAYRIGLVEPTDELREHGKESWGLAGDHPALRHSAPKPRGFAGSRGLLLGTASGVAVAIAALVFIVRGQWAVGLALAAATALFLLRFNRRVSLTHGSNAYENRPRLRGATTSRGVAGAGAARAGRAPFRLQPPRRFVRP